MPFHLVYNYYDQSQALAVWYDLFLVVLDKHAPVRKRRVRKSEPPTLLTDEIVKAMELRDNLRKQKLHTEYKKQRNYVQYLIREAKKKSLQEIVGEGKDISAVWKGLNFLTNKSKHPEDIPDNLTAEVFNKHFLSTADALIATVKASSVVSNPLEKIQRFCSERLSQNDQFKIPPIAVYEVGHYISHMKNKHSSGIDWINGNILQLSLPYTVDTLTYIYNLCITNTFYPDAFKTAKTIPLPKTNDLTDPNNFRPISVLSTLSKPLEKHIQHHLQQYLEGHSLISDFQSGFRPHHSCQTILTHLTNKWLLEINQSNMSAAVFLDFRKAFDLIDHTVLIKKLNFYLKNSSSVTFFKSYLEGRKQSVYLNGTFSSEGCVKYGVPQGSILGPTLFSLFINDLPLHISNENTLCEMFADDSTLHASGNTVQQITNSLQTSLDDVINWCSLNNMILNPDKTEAMLITTRQKLQRNPPDLKLFINDCPIKQVSEHNLLGVVIDDQLQWQPHINKTCKTVSKKLYLLSRIKTVIDLPTRKLFYNAYIKPHFDYVSNLWDGCSENQFKKLNSLHRRAAKLILSDQNITNDERLVVLNMLPLKKTLFFNKSIFMFKIINSDSPRYLHDLFKFTNNPYGDRKKNLQVVHPRIDLCKTSLSFSGASLWNSLPKALKTLSSLKTFKEGMLKLLWS